MIRELRETARPGIPKTLDELPNATFGPITVSPCLNVADTAVGVVLRPHADQVELRLDQVRSS